MTERLIDAVLALGGSFYLPYRLHARPEQFGAAYPRARSSSSRRSGTTIHNCASAICSGIGISLKRVAGRFAGLC